MKYSQRVYFFKNKHGKKDAITKHPVEGATQCVHKYKLVLLINTGRHLTACYESLPYPKSVSGSCKMPIVSCSPQTQLKI